MPASLRAFVQAACGIHGTEWANVVIPSGFGVDDSPRCELRLPKDPVFLEVLLDKRCRDDYTRYVAIPSSWSRLDLYDPPYCSNGSWDTFHDILRYPWELLTPHTSSPLFNKKDQDISALVSCAPTLAILARVLGVVHQSPINVRLIYWMENS